MTVKLQKIKTDFSSIKHIMKITIVFIVTAAATLMSNIEANNNRITTNNNREDKMSAACSNNGVWYQGNVPYEISQQFGWFI